MPSVKQLQELDKLNNSIRQKSLAYNVNKEYGQETLKEFYKPILDIKTKEQEIVKEQHKEELSKIQNLQEEIKKQQLLVPLIKSLSDHPRIVAVLKGESDGSELTGKEQYILKQLKEVDDRTLLILIDYFNKPNPEDVFVISARKESPRASTTGSPVDPPQYTKIPPELKSDKLGEWIINNDLPTKTSAELLFKKGRDDRSVTEIKGGVADFVTVLAQNGTPPSFNRKPWTTIRAADPEFYNQLSVISGKKLKPRGSSKAGTGLPIDEMVKKLEILYASKLAGNNNVLTEAREILNTLRRNGVIDIDMIKDISKRFINNK